MSQKNKPCFTREQLLEEFEYYSDAIEDEKDQLRYLKEERHKVIKLITSMYDGTCGGCENDHWPHCKK